MKQKPDVMLWLDDHRGRYIPRDFASDWKDRDSSVSGVDADEWSILEAGPDHPEYWDVWNDVLNNAVVTDENGIKYSLHQDGALWLIPEGMEWFAGDDWFKWPEDEQEDGPDAPGWEGGFADNH